MASQTGCEIMNSEVAGSILAVFPVNRKKGIISCLKEAVKLTHSKTTMGEIRSLLVTQKAKRSGVKLDTGYLIGVPDNLGSMSGLAGENVVENRVRKARARGSICCVTFLVTSH